jgi:hypothetical protein
MYYRSLGSGAHSPKARISSIEASLTGPLQRNRIVLLVQLNLPPDHLEEIDSGSIAKQQYSDRDVGRLLLAIRAMHRITYKLVGLLTRYAPHLGQQFARLACTLTRSERGHPAQKT